MNLEVTCRQRFSLIPDIGESEIERFRRKLTSKYTNQNQAAIRLGVTRGYISSIWRQKRPVPDWLKRDLKL